MVDQVDTSYKAYLRASMAAGRSLTQSMPLTSWMDLRFDLRVDVLRQLATEGESRIDKPESEITPW